MADSRKLARMCKALAADTRVKIVQLLSRKELCVNALAWQLGITAAAASQHLRVLEDAGIVAGEKRGYYMHYRIQKSVILNLQAALKSLVRTAGSTRKRTKN
jgi:DNA-binding transcriptional ArsR family regulator